MCSCLRSPVPADGACIAAAGAITRLSEEEKKGSDKEESASALSAGLGLVHKRAGMLGQMH